MKFSNHTTTIAAGAILFSAMALVGWQVRGGDQKAGTDGQIPTRENRSSSRFDRSPSQGKGLAAAKRMLRALEAEKDPVERMRATTALVNSLSSDDLLEWMDKRWFTCRDGFDLTLFSKLATERLSHEDPIGLLAWSMKDESNGSEASLKILSKSDPQALLDFFKENPNPYIEFRALASIAETNPTMAMDRLIELSASSKSEYSYQITATMVALAESSPKQLEDALGSLEGEARQTAEAALLGAKLNRSFGAEIQNLINQPDGLNLLKAAWKTSGAKLSATMLANIGSLPPAWQSQLAGSASSLINNNNASQWLAADLEGAGLTSQQADSIRMTCIRNLSYSTPEKALQGFLDLDRTSMNENSRNSVLQSIFSNQSSVLAATGLINMLDSEADRETARQIVQSAANSNPNVLRNVSTSAEWLEKAGNAGSEEDSTNRYYLAEAVRNLSKHQLGQLSEDFQNLPPDTRRNVAEILGSRRSDTEIEPNLKGQAISYLISNPPSEDEARTGSYSNPNALASMHVVKWAQTDPAAASAWTRTLPDSEAKTWATKNLAATWMQYDPAAAEKWIGALSPDTRREVKEFIDSKEP